MEKVFNHTAHRDLWQFLVDNPDKEKSDWPGWDHNGGEYEYDGAGCFACLYDDSTPCDETCPFVWANGHCNEKGSEFHSWENAGIDEKSALAARIRDLPVREGVKCI